MLENALAQISGDTDVQRVAAAGHDVRGVAAFVHDAMIAREK
jgi:hypothetical protein